MKVVEFLAKVRKSGRSKVVTIPYLEAERYEVGSTVIVTLSKPKTDVPQMTNG